MAIAIGTIVLRSASDLGNELGEGLEQYVLRDVLLFDRLIASRLLRQLDYRAIVLR